MQDFQFVMGLNRASVGLMKACATGQHIKTATLSARKAGKGMARDFGEVGELQVSRKGSASDFVTSADLKAEQFLFEALTKARPGYGFIGEERGLV